jgi:hypothetical protein
MRLFSLTRQAAVVTALLTLTLPAGGPVAAAAADRTPAPRPLLTLSDPEPGSFFTLYDHAPDGRLVSFDGFTVRVQRSRTSPVLVPVGTLPEQFRGGTDPAFVVVDPHGREVLLGAGAGGAKFPDPEFNGPVFRMSLRTGEVTTVGTFPFAIGGAFLDDRRFLMGQGETFGTFTGSVEVLDLGTGTAEPLVANIPGDPGGIALDRRGNLLAGLGAGQDVSRTGEIRRFDRHRVARALATGRPLDFDADSVLVTQVLNAGDLVAGRSGLLYVGGGDFVSRRDFGYVAVVDPAAGRVVARIDPVDGDPGDGDERSFDLAARGPGCELSMLDLFSYFNPEPATVYVARMC